MNDQLPHHLPPTPRDHRITLVHQAALGDTILLIPLLKSLRMRWRHAHIAIVTRPDFGKLLAHLNHVDAWHSADAPEHTAWFGAFDARQTLAIPAWARCDLLISAVSAGRDNWADHARAAMQATSGRIYFFQPRPPADDPRHVTQWHRDQLAELALPGAPPPETLNNPDGAILIHPGSGGAAKCWPAECFIELARKLVREHGRVEFILGEAELERWPKDLLQKFRDSFICHEWPSLVQLADLMRTARAWIGNDSGPTHLAAAIGLPGVALFGPSDDRQWRPVGHIKVLRAKLPYGHDLCALTVEEVLVYFLSVKIPRCT